MVLRFLLREIRGFFPLLILVFLPACATNPVTGRQEFMLLSDQEEVQMGTQTDGQIVKQYGLYEDARLAGYLEQMGRRLAGNSHRAGLTFHFKTLDSAVVNAFAVPGGYVYLTRGILAHLNSEAELAGVMGHEIGHITARHSAQQYSRAQVAQVGLGLGAVAGQFFPVIGGITTGLAQVGVGMLFLSFSRDNERQADSLAVEYASKSGYDGAQLASFFETLEKMDPGSDRSGLPSWFSTHPNPEDRLRDVRAQGKEWQARLGGRELQVNRNDYLRKIEGVIYGEDPRQGFVAEGVFYHPEMRFQFPVPPNWKLTNTPSNVQMVSESKDGLILFSPTKDPSPSEAAGRFVSQSKGRLVRSGAVPVNGLPARQTVTDHRTQKGDLRLVSYFIQKEKLVYVFHGVAPLAVAGKHEGLFHSTLSGFRTLADPARINIRPDRIRLRTVSGAGTVATALRSFGVAEQELKETALLNGKDPEERVSANTLLKVIEKGR